MLTVLQVVGCLTAYLFIACVSVAILFRISEQWREEDWGAWIVGIMWPIGMPLAGTIWLAVLLFFHVLGPIVGFLSDNMYRLVVWMSTPRTKQPKLPRMEVRK